MTIKDSVLGILPEIQRRQEVMQKRNETKAKEKRNEKSKAG
jgi:hypothetical protein